VGALFSSELSFTEEMLLWEDGVGVMAPQGEGDDVPSPLITPAGA
jgi:hypothetical protein